MVEFISENDLETFEGWLKYQAVPATTPMEELVKWRALFDENLRRRENSPKVGLMKLRRKPGEQKYAVAIKDGLDLWLTLWIRCKPNGEVFIMYPRNDGKWNAHASYHLNGTLHQKSYGVVGLFQKRQPLTEAFIGSEHLGNYMGHGKIVGAVCDPAAFDGVVIVDPNILRPKHGTVGIELVEPGRESELAQTSDLNGVYLRQVFARHGRPSLVITIQR